MGCGNVHATYDSCAAEINRSGTLAARPAAGPLAPAGTTYFATDNGRLYHSNGTNWTTIPAVNSARVYHNATQALVTGSNTQLAFNSERYDTANFHDTVTNNGRLTIPAGADGLYRFGANITFAANIVGRRSVWIGKSGILPILVLDERGTVTTAGRPASINIAAEEMLAAGDFLVVYAVQESGGNLDVSASDAGNIRYQADFWISQA